MKSLDEVLASLERVKKLDGTDRFSARCPAHEDRSPSLSVWGNPDGSIGVECHAGCPRERVLECLGISSAPARSKPPRMSSRGKRAKPTPLRREPDQVYSYEDPDSGEVLFEVCRWDEPEGKIIRQRTCAPDGSLTWSLEGVKRHPLFRERALLEAPDRPLLVVEGEKGVEAVLSLGLDVLVTTNPMGAGKWRPEHTQALEGRSGGVVVVPDCDKAGRDHAAKVVQSLCEAGVQARLLDLWPERSDGFDIADFIEGNRAEASEWLRSQIGPTFEMLEHSVDGHFCRTRAFSDMRPEEPRPLIEDLIFLRCINILTGKPGSGKTNVAADLAAKVTLGKGARFAKSVSHPGYKVALDSPGSVLFISADEPVESAFQPRFLANGGDASRAFSLDEAIGADGKESLLNLTNLAPLESALRRHKPVLVIIDGMVAFTGRSKIYQPEEVYQLLRPLRVLAEKYDVAILLIRHQNKGQPEVIEDSGQGSVSFQGIARSEILIGKSPTTGQRAIFPIKQNYARGDLEPLDFRLEDAVIQDADGADVRTCHVVWEGASTLQLEDLFRKPAKASKKALAESFLRERLEGGEKVPVQTLMKEAPVGWRTVERAKDELEEDGFEISLGPIGFRGPWSWWHELSSARDGAPAPERHDPANGCGDLLAESERPESDSPLF